MSSSLQCLNVQGPIPSAREIWAYSSLVLSTRTLCWVNAISTRARKPAGALQKGTELVFEKKRVKRVFLSASRGTKGYYKHVLTSCTSWVCLFPPFCDQS